MSEELKNESANQTEQLDTQPEVNGTQSGSGDGERKFTQDEVNRIVKESLQPAKADLLAKSICLTADTRRSCSMQSTLQTPMISKARRLPL